MAKLNAPLFSFNASGKIANALVYFSWKGLDVVRSYVVPANPKTSGQVTQRGYLTTAVRMLHEYQALPANFFGPGDTIGYALWGSIYPTPRTWFNQVCKNWVDRKVAGKIPAIFGNVSVSPGGAKLTVIMGHSPESSAVVSGKLWYGTSRTALIHSVAATMANLLTGVDIPGLTKGVKYYVQFRPLLPDTFLGNKSGIYYGVPS